MSALNIYLVILALIVWMITTVANVSTELKPSDEQNENRSSRFSAGYYLFLPAAGLAFVLFRQNIFTKLLLQFDRNCVSVICPSFSSREKLLAWACKRLPSTWSSQSKTLSGGVAELWSDGSLLCTLINTVIPGACPNPHRHWRQPPSHAQALAYKYFGIVPIFTDTEISGNLTPNLERKFLRYLNELQQLMDKLTENYDSRKMVSTQYVGRGMGLFSGEQNRKTTFYIYPDAKNKSDINSNVIIQVRGPYGTNGEAVVPKFRDEFFKNPEVNIISDILHSKKLLNKYNSRNFMRKLSLPFVGYQKKHVGENIEIDVTIEKGRARITYIPRNFGMYEINMIANGELLRGCPFNVHIFNNTSDINETFKSDKKVEEPQNFRKRKVISKTIDLIDEKLGLAELRQKYQSNGETDIANKMEEMAESKFTFQETVDEITKSGAVFRDIEMKSSNSATVTDSGNNDDERKSSENYGILTSPELVSNSNKVFRSEETDEPDSNYLSTNKNRFTSSAPISTIEEIEEVELPIGSEKINQILLCEPAKDVPSGQNVTETELLELDLGFQENNSENIYNNSVKIPVTNEFEKQIQNTDNANKNSTLPELNILDTHNKNLTGKSHILSKPQLADKVCYINGNNNYTSKQDVFRNLNKDEIKSTFTNATVSIADKNNTNILSHNELPLYDENGKFPNKYHVNKIKIPEKFTEHQNQSNANNLKNNLNNIVSSKHKQTNKIHSTNYLEKALAKDSSGTIKGDVTSVEDVNNNEYPHTKEIKTNLHKNAIQTRTKDSDKLYSLGNRFYKTLNASIEISKSDSLEITNYTTSSICSDHIVPEVEYRQIPVAEKRKIFSQNSTTSLNNTTNSSFSKRENVEGSKAQDNSKFEGLSVLQVLGSLKQSRSLSTEESFSLCSTVSLPNISLESESSSSLSVQERKQFWEAVSSRSSTSLSTKFLNSSKKMENNLNDYERSRLIWKKPIQHASITDDLQIVKKEKSPDVYKSADNILKLDYIQYQKPLRYKSLDSSLENCTMLSIEERKQILLKQNYEKEKIGIQKIKTSKVKTEMQHNRNDINCLLEKNVNKLNDSKFISPVLDKIRKFNSVSNLNEMEKKNNEIKLEDTNKTSDISKNYLHNDLKNTQQSENQVKSHFRKAIKYFKNLEEKSLGKIKSKNTKKQRKFSLDTKSYRDKSRRRGGSLNLSNTSERFLVDNLYKDIFGDKRGSLRGTPNRSALVEALATFSRRENYSYNLNENEEDIKYEIFKKQLNRKKRRSIRSIFELYY